MSANDVEYLTVIWLDTNVIFECLPLVDLPWHEIDAEGPILILIAPQTLKEIDKRKKDGRLAQRARDFNRLIAPAALSGLAVRICEKPVVNIKLAVCSKIDWDLYDDLSRTEGDERFIAEALHVKDFEPRRLLVVGQDTYPLDLARRHGLKPFRVSESWLGKPEPSPLEKENAKLKRELAEYKKSEPTFECYFEVVPPQPIRIFKIEPLDPATQDDLANEIRAKNPKTEQSHRADPFFSANFDSTYDDRYDAYFDVTVPEFCSSIHSRLELKFSQVPFQFTFQNSGVVPGEHLFIDIEVIGGWLHEKPIFAGTFPCGPSIEPNYRRGLFRHDVWTQANAISTQIGRHEVDVSELKRSAEVTLKCEDFRQDQIFTMEGVLWLDPNYCGATTIVVKATASNYRNRYSKVFKIQKLVDPKQVFSLIDRENGAPLADAYVTDLISAALKGNNFDSIDLDPFAK